MVGRHNNANPSAPPSPRYPTVLLEDHTITVRTSTVAADMSGLEKYCDSASYQLARKIEKQTSLEYAHLNTEQDQLIRRTQDLVAEPFKHNGEDVTVATPSGHNSLDISSPGHEYLELQSDGSLSQSPT